MYLYQSQVKRPSLRVPMSESGRRNPLVRANGQWDCHARRLARNDRGGCHTVCFTVYWLSILCYRWQISVTPFTD